MDHRSSTEAAARGSDDRRNKFDARRQLDVFLSPLSFPSVLKTPFLSFLPSCKIQQEIDNNDDADDAVSDSESDDEGGDGKF